MDIAELVGQEVAVPVLEGDDAPEIGGGNDVDRWRRQEPDAGDVGCASNGIPPRAGTGSATGTGQARGPGLGRRPCRRLGHAAPSTSVRSRSAWSVVIRASIKPSR